LRDVRIDDAWGGPIDITADHLPTFASLPGRPIHFGHGYSGNGVAPSLLGGRILAALALERADDPVLELPLIGVRPRPFPPNRSGTSVRASCARRSFELRRPMNAARGLLACSGSSADCRDASGIYSGPSRACPRRGPAENPGIG
jgi:hypothetical protein